MVLYEGRVKNDERTFKIVGILWSIWFLRIKLIFNPRLKLVPKDLFEILNLWKRRGKKVLMDLEKDADED